MAWIELHQTLPRHPKLARLANRLRVTRAQAAGHLTFLWLWALDYCPTGDISALEPAEISAAADFGGDAELFVQALKQSGWLEDDGMIHDWMDYAGKLMEQRAYQSGKKREMTKAYKSGVIEAVRNRDGDHCRYCRVKVDWGDKKGATGATYDHVIPGFEATLENLVVSCRSCNSRKGQRTPEQAGMEVLNVSRSVPDPTGRNLATVPNSTVPNRTQPNPPAPREGASARPANVEEVVGVGAVCGVSEADCRSWHTDMEACGWAKVDGTPFGNWKRELTIHRDRLRERQARQSGQAKPPTGERREIQENIQIRKAVINGVQ